MLTIKLRSNTTPTSFYGFTLLSVGPKEEVQSNVKIQNLCIPHSWWINTITMNIIFRIGIKKKQAIKLLCRSHDFFFKQETKTLKTFTQEAYQHLFLSQVIYLTANYKSIKGKLQCSFLTIITVKQFTFNFFYPSFNTKLKNC